MWPALWTAPRTSTMARDVQRHGQWSGHFRGQVYVRRRDRLGQGLHGLLECSGCDCGRGRTAASILRAFSAGTVDFDPGAGRCRLTARLPGCFRLQVGLGSGNFVWAADFGGTSGAAEGFGIAVASDGSVYTTGQFDGHGGLQSRLGHVQSDRPHRPARRLHSKLDSAGNFGLG